MVKNGCDMNNWNTISIVALITAFIAAPANARHLRRHHSHRAHHSHHSQSVDHTPAVAKYLEDSGIKVDENELKACASDGDESRSMLWERPKYLAITLKSFARSVCRSSNDPSKVAMLESAPNSKASFVQLASLQSTESLRIPSRESSDLINTYALLLGLGLRESDGNFKEGADRTARHSSSSTIEAGAFQTSYNIRSCLGRVVRGKPKHPGANRGLVSLEQAYANASAADCMNMSGGNVRVPDASRSSSNFQVALKACPALAVEHAAITMQCRNHYGPLKRGEAKIMRKCVPLMRSIAVQAASDPSLCESVRLGGPTLDSSAPILAPRQVQEASAASTIIR